LAGAVHYATIVLVEASKVKEAGWEGTFAKTIEVDFDF
jgi:hypothetical protein